MSETQTVLVTGSSGFLGRAVTMRLQADGIRVIGFDQAMPDGGAEHPLVLGNVEDVHRIHAALAAERPTQILHLGALSGPMLAQDDPHLMVRINIHGTANVLEAARVTGVERVVFLSSIMTYGAQPVTQPVTEDAPLNACDAYGASKIAGEALMRAYACEHGLDTVSLRVGNAYGPGRRTDCMLRLMIENTLAEKVTKLVYGKGCSRQYVYLDDVVEAVVRTIARRRLPRPAYNVTAGMRTTLDDVAATVKDVLCDTRIELGERPHPFDYPIGPLDLTAARKDLGYAPAIGLADGIRAYADWIKGKARRGEASARSRSRKYPGVSAREEPMPFATTTDDVKLHYEETGSGTPIIFVHEFAGDSRSWEPQVRYLCRCYRCIVFNARGYPPSDVPTDIERYSQDRARDDIRDVMDALGIEKAHIVGLSMGGFAALHFGLRYPERALSLVIAGCGYGAKPETGEEFRKEVENTARLFDDRGSKEAAEVYGSGPWRVPYQVKDPRGWREFVDQLAEHDAIGAARTMRGVQMHRPSLWDLRDEMRRMTVPILIITGDEDEPCLEPCLMMKRTIPSAALIVLPKCGHAINIEEPAGFNAAIADFMATVDAGRWAIRDPRSAPGVGVLGMR